MHWPWQAFALVMVAVTALLSYFDLNVAAKVLGRTHPRHGSPYIASFTQSAIALAIVGGFWAAGQDPYASLYTLTAILGTLALLVVQSLCSFAVIAYFRRNHPESRHWSRTLTAPLLGGLAMIAAIVLLVLKSHTL